MNELIEMAMSTMPQFSAASLVAVFFFATFISEDAACLAAGAAVANGQISFAAAVGACLLGIFIGDVLLFAAGRLVGDRVFESPLAQRFISNTMRSKARRWLETHGAVAVFLSRFTIGLRLPTYVAAGALKTNPLRFVLYFLIAAGVWTPLLVGSVAFTQSLISNQDLFITILLVFTVLRLMGRYSSWKNRRLLIGRLKRIANWEFWPLPLLYAPVVVYTLWLAIRFRSTTAFTAVNPSMPAGGFRGESKDEIYKFFVEDTDEILAHQLIPGGLPPHERLASAQEFISQRDLSFPIVLKPDVGERGKGVKIVNDLLQLAEVLQTEDRSLVLQQYVTGEEVSIFYYRRPHEARGHIFSITEKQFPEVRGDGRSTVEELILADRRAVALAPKYFEQNLERLAHVPGKGEHIRLIDIGTHSRGAIFLDGERHRTAALEARIDDICGRIDGFYFGRFDIRVPSFDDLQRGENLKIIELNGVTSESTNIYDPRHSLADAYRILFTQWRIAFEIGSENIKLGAKSCGLFSLAKMAMG